MAAARWRKIDFKLIKYPGNGDVFGIKNGGSICLSIMSFEKMVIIIIDDVYFRNVFLVS